MKVIKIFNVTTYNYFPLLSSFDYTKITVSLEKYAYFKRNQLTLNIWLEMNDLSEFELWNYSIKVMINISMYSPFWTINPRLAII